MTEKELYNMRQANYMQLRKLSEASEEAQELSTEPVGALQTAEVLRLVSTILQCHSRGILTPESALHAVRELVKE